MATDEMALFEFQAFHHKMYIVRMTGIQHMVVMAYPRTLAQFS
jgi:hypothetical protein